MNIVLLSGGSGKRLWPLSNDIRSKQFIKLFKDENGEYQSMIQRMYHKICEVNGESDITVATNKSQISEIRNQLGDCVSICVEPCRRDTFPAIVLATAYLHDVKGISEEEAVVVCPVDPYVGDEYFRLLNVLWERAKNGSSNLSLMGIEPEYPSEKYGYIIPETSGEISRIKTFKEKPDEKTAEEYIKDGALWNGGVFAYKIKYVLDKAQSIIGFNSYDRLFSEYEKLEKISFDYAVTEKEPNVEVIKYSGEWKDLGTWNTLTEAMEERSVGNASFNESCENVHVVNELDIPVLCMGLKDVIVSASPEGILISDKEQSNQIKPYVDKIDIPVMFAEKSWGDFYIIDRDDNCLTIKLTIKQGKKMNYHSHERREEIWTVISGCGSVIIDGEERKIRQGDSVTIKAGSKHTIIADTLMKVIEVQLGNNISVSDKKKFDD